MELNDMVAKVVRLYWEAPGGRGVRHLNDVLSAAPRLAGRALTDRELLTIALHDIGVGRKGWERDDHPVAALAAIATDEALAPLRPMVDDEMAWAIAHHMHEAYDISGVRPGLHKLLVEADEGIPVWGKERIMKPVKYWLDGRNKSLPPDAPIDEATAYIVGRLRKKVDTFKSGRPPFTDRYCSVFAWEIERASEWAMGLSEKDVRECIAAIKEG